jgi:hypothetical protein
MSIVIFTTLVCGGTTAPMLRALGLTNSARLVDNVSIVNSPACLAPIPCQLAFVPLCCR